MIGDFQKGKINRSELSLKSVQKERIVALADKIYNVVSYHNSQFLIKRYLDIRDISMILSNTIKRLVNVLKSGSKLLYTIIYMTQVKGKVE